MLSVIIPNYNGEKTVLKTIESVYDLDCEIIVVDDCSTDDSVRVIKNNFPKVNVLKNDSVKWVAYSRNLGIKESKGEYLLFLDNDLYMTPNSVEKLLSEIKKYDIVFPVIDFENGVRMHPRGDESAYTGISCAFMISRDSLGSLNEFFDETYQFYMEDSDFFLRCKLLGLKSKWVTEARAIHILKSEVTNQLQKYFFRVRNMIYFYTKMGFSGSGLKRRNLARFLLKNFFINCMLNYSERMRYQDALQASGLEEKIRLLFNHPRLVDNRVDLLKAFFRGVWWNLANYKLIVKKRNEFGAHLRNY